MGPGDVWLVASGSEPGHGGAVNRTQAAAGFRQVYGRDPAGVSRAPGRVNLIGEHTDYNDGLVLPAALEAATWTAAAVRDDRRLRVHAANPGDSVEFDLDAPGPPRQGHWSDYVRGMAVALETDGFRLRGTDLRVAGTVPEGAGLSSSAALTMSVGLALLEAAGLAWDGVRLALAGQRAEREFAGTQCGVMDPFVSVHARAGTALLLDCRSLTFRHLPIPGDLRLAICDSGVRHQLAGGEYNRRRAECEDGVERWRTRWPEIRALRDLTPERLAEGSDELPETIRRRCRHVVSENARVEAFATALEQGDRARMGTLMEASHRSLRDDYEVSCMELDLLVDLAQSAPGTVGARMTGGGFGGSTVNLVEAGSVDAFQKAMIDGYGKATGRALRVFVTAAGEGASWSPL